MAQIRRKLMIFPKPVLRYLLIMNDSPVLTNCSNLNENKKSKTLQNQHHRTQLSKQGDVLTYAVKFELLSLCFTKWPAILGNLSIDLL